MNPWMVLFFFMCVRLCTVFIVQTWYVPDEYWQSVEVAHRIAFGYGYLTWEWIHGIRSYVYPVLLATVFNILKYFNLDSLNTVLYAPRIFQALLSAVGDYFFWRWYRSQNSGGGMWAVFVIVTSWFSLYCGSRTLINSFEATLNTIALSMFPWHETKMHRSSSSFLWCVGLACIVRPTAAIVWIPMCIYHIAMSYHRVNIVIKDYLPIGLLIPAGGILLDSYYYGKITFTLLNFFKTNIMEGINIFYGSHQAHWYLTSGIPVVLGCHLVSFLLGAYKILQQKRKQDMILLFVIVWTVVLLSMVPHKEFRFLLPLMPFFMYIKTSWLSSWSRKARKSLVWFVTAVLFVGNLALLAYFGLVHQRGSLDVMKMLATHSPTNMNVMFLMPCHSTPLYSHLHANVKTRFLTCEPDFSHNPDYEDEAEGFYRSPEQWLHENFPLNENVTHVVIYNLLYPKIKYFLSQHNYKLNMTLFHTFHPSGRVGTHIEVYTHN